LLSWLAPVAIGIGLLAVPAEGATWGGSRSGLPWASGSNSGMDGLESLRGRRLDVRTMFFGYTSWGTLAGSSAAIGQTMARGGRLAIALGMLPRSHAGQHERCAAGGFDAEIRAVSNGIVRRGGHDAIIRLGWEANRVRGYPWAVTGDGSAYKECFRRWVSILRSVPGQDFVIDWNMAQAGTFPHIDRMYPGDDVVDVIGVQQYDRCPPAANDAEWERTYWERKNTGSPVGLGPWLEYARSKGKRLSVPEWGVGGPRNVCGNPGFDNPFFIRKMYDFFRTNAESIAYEAYFNGDDGSGNDENGSHRLTPSHYNPKSAAAYRALWSAGASDPPAPPNPPPGGRLSILSAYYYGLSAMCDARQAIAASCDGRSSCTVNASDGLCGDPEPMVLKRLGISYACRAAEQSQDVPEGTVMTLQCL
jgi:hypothetical protein